MTNQVIILLLAIFFFISCNENNREKRVLVFSKTEGFRHDCIPEGIAAIKKLGRENGFKVFPTEDAALFNEKYLKDFSAVIFLNTTGDVLDNIQQADFERFIQAGGGFVGIHSAADTEYDWKWYNDLVGAYFESHPKQQDAGIDVVNPNHPSTKMLPKRWDRFDEWYNYKSIKGHIEPLLNLDESSYEGGKNGNPHPIAWFHEFDGGRAFYTGGGHTKESYQEELFLQHILGGIEWAIGENRLDYKASTTYRVPPEDRFVQTVLAFHLYEPMELDVFDDGGVIFVERRGAIKLWNPKTEELDSITKIDVWTEFEDGLMGLAIDPDYEKNHWVYVYYSPPDSEPRNRVSRFLFDGEKWDHDSEQIILEVKTQRDECCHSGGSLEFDKHGNLYLSTGDDTNPFASNGFAPIDERPGRSAWDAQGSSANPNDLRGKILRIHPEKDGSYTIPEGNLFPEGTPNTRPEIFVMGCRNPFRIHIDSKNDWLYWGDVGPDAGKDGEMRGPKGIDEINQAKVAGNFGWPYFRGDGKVYYDYNFTTKESGDLFDPKNPINDSPNNTGIKELPAFQPSLIWYSYDDSEEFPWTKTGGKNPMAGPVFHKENVESVDNSFPDYFEDKLFIYEWVRDWIFIVKIDSLGNFVKADPFMPNAHRKRPMDMAFGKDGALYMLEYGEKWYGKNLDAQLSKIEYVRGNRRPVPKIEADKIVGGAPLTVNFSASKSIDYDEDPMTYEWTFTGSSVQSTEISPTFTFKYPGTYKVKLRAIEKNGGSATTKMEIQVGNTPPEVEWKLVGNQSFYWDDRLIDYQVKVKDEEDGSSEEGSIPAKEIQVNIDYIAEGLDLTLSAQGHQTQQLSSEVGQSLIDQSDCSTCHAVDKKINGPSYMEIGNRYRLEEFAIRDLSKRIIEGSSGNWGETAMIPHPDISQREAEEIVHYILSLAGKSDIKNNYSLEGLVTLNDHLKEEESSGIYALFASYADRGANGIQSISNQQKIILQHHQMQAEKATLKSDGINIADYNAKRDVMGGLRHQQYFGFENLDLTNIKEIILRVAPQNGGTIEIRLDELNGELIGDIEIPKGQKPYKMQSLNIQIEPQKHFHDIYFVMKNTEERGGLIGMIDWVQFEVSQGG